MAGRLISSIGFRHAESGPVSGLSHTLNALIDDDFSDCDGHRTWQLIRTAMQATSILANQCQVIQNENARLKEEVAKLKSGVYQSGPR